MGMRAVGLSAAQEGHAESVDAGVPAPVPSAGPLLQGFVHGGQDARLALGARGGRGNARARARSANRARGPIAAGRGMRPDINFS